MKKITFLFLSLFSFCILFAQKIEKPVYFPTEQIIHPNVSEEENLEIFLSNLIRNTLKTFIKKGLKNMPFKKDTLGTYISFSVHSNGQINDSLTTVQIGKKVLNIKVSDSVKAHLSKFPKFEVLNWKKEPYSAVHRFHFRFLVENINEKIVIEDLISGKKYSGGAIHELPIPLECNEYSNKEMQKCFNKFIRNHIVSNFKYPEKAINLGAEGTVYVNFYINEDGKINKIKGFGGYEVLVKQAEKIFKKLPKVKAGLLNGEPYSVNFTIPIKFALR